MNKFIKNRAYEEASHIIKTKDTIRATAKKFQVSKSTVYKDLTSKIDKNTLKEVKAIFKEHNKTKHIKGGIATKNKYKR